MVAFLLRAAPAAWVPPSLRPQSAYFLAQAMLMSAGWEARHAAAARSSASAGGSSAADVDVYANADIQAMGDEFFADFGRGGRGWNKATSPCGWGCAGAVDDHDAGEAQAELRSMSGTS